MKVVKVTEEIEILATLGFICNDKQRKTGVLDFRSFIKLIPGSILLEDPEIIQHDD